MFPDLSPFGVFGSSAAMQPVLRLVEQAAAAGRPVLLCGEPGTGRGRIARAIHALGGGEPDAFVRLDCNGGGSDELEARLFGSNGHGRVARARTASSEALASDSLLWQAARGTLYLAGIVEMPSPVQVRISRLMRDREAIAPDGAPVRFDCRMIAAVEPDFELALEEGRFRRELFARFSAVRIDVPPLRERKEDIPALAAFFLEQFAVHAGVTPKRLSGPAALLLQALPWRENAWELRGLLETLAQWVPGDTIDLSEVLSSVRLDPHARSVAVGGTLRSARQRFEREYVYAVLQHYGWQVPAAAKALGIQRTNLYRKMRSLGVARFRSPESGIRSPESVVRRGHNGLTTGGVRAVSGSRSPENTRNRRSELRGRG